MSANPGGVGPRSTGDRRVRHPEPDQIVISGLEVFAHHGVHDVERDEGQRFLVDVALDADTRIAARTDDLDDAVDYADVVARVAELVRSTRYDLLEALGARIADELLGRAGIAAVSVRLTKPDVELPEAVASVSVTVNRVRPTHPR